MSKLYQMTYFTKRYKHIQVNATTTIKMTSVCLEMFFYRYEIFVVVGSGKKKFLKF